MGAGVRAQHGPAPRFIKAPWQQVYYAEFDGQRPKRVIVKVMGE